MLPLEQLLLEAHDAVVLPARHVERLEEAAGPEVAPAAVHQLDDGRLVGVCGGRQVQGEPGRVGCGDGEGDVERFGEGGDVRGPGDGERAGYGEGLPIAR